MQKHEGKRILVGKSTFPVINWPAEGAFEAGNGWYFPHPITKGEICEALADELGEFDCALPISWQRKMLFDGIPNVSGYVWSYKNDHNGEPVEVVERFKALAAEATAKL